MSDGSESLSAQIGRLLVRGEWKNDWHIPWTFHDGEQLQKKAVVLCAPAAYTGILWGALNVTMGSVKGLGRGLLFFGETVGPNLAAAVVYVYTTALVSNVRGKNDCYNHLAGGMAAGSVYLAKHAKPVRGAYMMLGLGLLGLSCKEVAVQPFFTKFEGVPKQTKKYFITGHRKRIPTNLD